MNEKNGFQVTKVLDKIITIEKIILTITVEVVLVMITTTIETGLTASALTAVRKIRILVNRTIMEITMITP